MVKRIRVQATIGQPLWDSGDFHTGDLDLALVLEDTQVTTNVYASTGCYGAVAQFIRASTNHERGVRAVLFDLQVAAHHRGADHVYPGVEDQIGLADVKIS